MTLRRTVSFTWMASGVSKRFASKLVCSDGAIAAQTYILDGNSILLGQVAITNILEQVLDENRSFADIAVCRSWG